MLQIHNVEFSQPQPNPLHLVSVSFGMIVTEAFSMNASYALFSFPNGGLVRRLKFGWRMRPTLPAGAGHNLATVGEHEHRAKESAQLSMSFLFWFSRYTVPAITQVKGKVRNSTTAPSETPNRSSPKLAW